MANKEDKINKSRLRTSYITTTVSISLVIFLLGAMGLLILNAKKISDHVKENLGFNIMLKDEAKEVDIIRLQKTLDAEKYVKSTEFISKEEAAAELQKDLGEDFVGFLGYNPLKSNIEVKFKADYATPESIAKVEKSISKNPLVSEIFYREDLIHLLNENITKISFILLLFSGLLFIISFALINNTIRLSIYSKRFIIRTMQLVGATKGFIRRPFLLSGSISGLLGAIIAVGLLLMSVYWLQNQLEGVISIKDIEILGVLFGLVILVGIFIAYVATFFAVSKFLRMRTDKLYY